MLEPKSPCMGCDDRRIIESNGRSLSCHDVCPRYKLYREKKNEYNKLVHQNRRETAYITWYEVNKGDRLKKFRHDK